MILLLCTAAVDLMGLIRRADEHEKLVDENRALKESAAGMDRRLSVVTAELERVHNMTNKLKVITALTDENPTNSPAANAGFAESEDEPAQRGPASEGFTADVTHGLSRSVRQLLTQMFASEDAKEELSLSEKIEQTLQESRLREQEMMTTWGALSDRQNMLAAMPSIKPAHGYFSSLFGYRFDPINGRPLLHAGVDIAAPWGTQVLAPGDGVVSYVGYEGGYGNLVAIDHGYGVTTRFAHNSRIFVRQGQRVRRWEPISAVGSTGHSTGAHVHYEVRVRGLPVDPTNYILQDN